MKNNRSVLLVLALTFPLASPAVAQTYGDNWGGETRDRVLLVDPDGEVLDYIPDSADVELRRNRRGQRVLVDHYGNIIATEVSPDDYLDGQGRAEGRKRRGDRDIAYPRNDARGQGYGEDFFPAAPDDGDTDTLTGTVPLGQEQFGDFQDQPLPGDGIREGNGDDLAAIDPQQEIIEEKPADPEITLEGKKSQFEITALQVFLDRAGASPGVIDGKMGSNVSKAIRAYDKITGETLDPNNIEDILTQLGYSGGLPVTEYTITSADAAGPYVAEIPVDYAHKAALPAMSYTSVTEALAERFHMDENYLKALNPNADFTMPGTVIKVVNPGLPKKATVTRIVADKSRKQIFAYGEDGNLVAAYPASIGSDDTPSPTGTHTVERVALDPNYTYNPKINFQQGNNTKVLTIPPGPNGPVGTVWIALSKPTYGIHGTPDPTKIGRTQSHGCIRLTNWDATELAKMVNPGVTVEFLD